MSSRHHQDKRFSRPDETDHFKHLERLITNLATTKLLFVGGIPQIASRFEVLSYIERFGELKFFSMPHNNNSLHHMGFAKVKFAQDTDYHRFLKQRVHFIHQKEVGVKEWVSKESYKTMIEQPSDKKLFFKYNSPLAELEIHHYFSFYGQVRSVILIEDHLTNQLKDFGFIEFKSRRVAQGLLECSNQHVINGKSVKVFPSKSREELKGAGVSHPHNGCSRAAGKIEEGRVAMTQQFEHKTSNGSYIRNLNGEPNNSSLALLSKNLCLRKDRTATFMCSKVQDSANTVKSFQKMFSNFTTNRNHDIKVKCRDKKSRQVPVSSTLASIHMKKPCTKMWHHIQIAENHNEVDNIEFKLAVPPTKRQH